MTQKHIYLNIRQNFQKPTLLTHKYNLKFNLQYYLQLKKLIQTFLKKFNLYLNNFKYILNSNYLYINIEFFISYLFYSKITKIKNNFLYKNWINKKSNNINITNSKYHIFKKPSSLSLIMHKTNLLFFNNYQTKITKKLLNLIKKFTNINKTIIIKFNVLNALLKWKTIKKRIYTIFKQLYKKYLYFFVKNTSFILYDLFLQFFLLFKTGKLINQLTISLIFLFKRQLNSRKIFRVLKTFLSYFTSFKKIKGIKIQLKGRIRGNRRKKKLTLNFKKTSSSNLHTNLQYTKSAIKTKYGILGLQIWVSTYNMNL